MSPSDIIQKKDVQEMFGRRFLFEYHCFESPYSQDAPIWRRTQQIVEVVSLSECEDMLPMSFSERCEEGLPLVFMVKFPDGLVWNVFEDELIEEAQSIVQ